MKAWMVAACAAFTFAPAWAQILIGQTAGFSGVAEAGVKETSNGAKLWIDHVNAKGGVNGQKIEIIALDDAFDPKKAVANAKVLIEEKNVVALFLNRGTPHTEGVMPLLEKYGVPLVAPSTGAMSLHQPVNKWIFNVRATYQREAEKAVEYLSTVGITRIAVLHTDDSFGADGLEGAKKGFTKAKLEPTIIIKTDRNKPDFAQIIPAVTRTDPQALVWIASGNAVADGVKALRKAGSAAQVVTLSNNASGGFIKSLGDSSRGVIVTQVFPYERSIAYPMVKEARDLARAKGSDDISPAMLEGYAAAKVLVEALRRCSPPVTREKLQKALESMQHFDLGGLEVSYSPTDHTGLDFADLSIIGVEGKFRR
ncbi:ABC transporter substrate-binding protein [Ramlibacter sp. G-1-2-2]|uniref:ABC transporter substrate-binding protein n=1 Tax=Ramlibacter agri TaxID=2728837 RepID=A0A848HB75_9BURK|nr:ABC transporter substrate-binding protein [Ramlibacter agri]NML47302.1 ABC transporter substrate-binding protein [Ramlibacter agri]